MCGKIGLENTALIRMNLGEGQIEGEGRVEGGKGGGVCVVEKPVKTGGADSPPTSIFRYTDIAQSALLTGDCHRGGILGGVSTRRVSCRVRAYSGFASSGVLPVLGYAAARDNRTVVAPPTSQLRYT